MKKFIYLTAIVLICIGFPACEKEDLEKEQNLLSVNFSDGLDVSEREILNRAKDLVLESATITDGKYNLSNINPIELGIADRLFKYIQVNSAYLNSKIDQGVFKISGKILVPACDEESALKARPKNMHMSAVTADDPNEPIGGGSSLVLERFENAKDWFKVYSENGYTVWEYTNTTYTYSTRYTWVNNPYVYKYGENYRVYFDPSGDPIPSPKPKPVPEIDEDPSWIDTKADCVYDKLKEGGPNSIMNQLLGGYMLDKKKIQLTFKTAGREIFKKDNVNGRTRYNPNTKTSVIYLNNRNLTHSPLEIARTILHECFHAYLHSINPNKMNLNYTASFEQLIDNYNVKNGDYSHNDMANKYRDEIERGLRAFINTNEDLYSWANQKEADDPNFNMDDLLESMAWEGLQNTKLFNEKYANNKSLYEEEIVKYRRLLINENGDFGTLPKDCN